MTPRCKAQTKSGKPCRGRAQAGTDYCGPHQPASNSPSREVYISKNARREIWRSLKSSGRGAAQQKVYVIASAERVPGVKIGVATDVQDRLAGLQVARPDRLRVAGVVIPSVGTAFALEQAAHAIARRYRMRGEWFDLSAQSALHAVQIADAAIAAGGSPHQIAERLASRVLLDDLRTAADRVNADRRKAAAR